ncbi:molybdenum ABC transporter ATP-binding protein [Iodidimonas sp. SYSU 1G8]|uniref:molybdenum ABC transporter ATP-binding protein n=1 Tax=Iodidimonas sp. SYSU 1G8 TaxID=3133967 RepID=UPI0031FEF6D9
MALVVDVKLRRGDVGIGAAFRAESGITVIAGPSGAGKTSVVSALAGLLRPTSGRIEVDGAVLFDSATGIDLPPSARRIGYVLQDPLLFPHLSVRRNLTYSRRRGALTLEEVADILGIGHLFERRPASLSGGERQRVAIGRALLSSPSMLLMDEPLASLDAGRRAELLPFIETLRERLRLPIVYVTHNWSEIIRLADTLVIMRNGHVATSGPLQSMLTSTDPDVAALVPEGSVIDGVPARHAVDGLNRIDTPAGPLFVPQPPSQPATRVRLFIDAYDVTIALRRPEGLSVQNVLEAILVSLEPRGESHLDLRLALAGDQLIRARITRHAGQTLNLRPGMTVFALVKSVAFERRLQWQG